MVARVACLVGLVALAGASYTVRPGDTLSEIAEQQGVSVSALVESNDLDDPDRIRAGEELTLPEPPEIPAVQTATAPRAEVGALIERVASERGWSPAFVKALAWQESGWNNDRVSPSGAVGIMQVMPTTGGFVSERLVGRELDLTDPQDNVLAGVAYLQYLWEVTDGDTEQTLAGYYQGLSSVRENGRYASTDRYIANVLALRDRFR